MTYGKENLFWFIYSFSFCHHSVFVLFFFMGMILTVSLGPTKGVARKVWKIQGWIGTRTLSSEMPVQCSTRLSYQADWEVAVMWVDHKSGEDGYSATYIWTTVRAPVRAWMFQSFSLLLTCTKNTPTIIHIRIHFNPQFKHMNLTCSNCLLREYSRRNVDLEKITGSVWRNV